MPLESGGSLLHYRLVEKIGEGGMGVVWKARDTNLNRDVAIKVLPPELSHDAERLARLQREARTLASIHHPNVASIFGLEEAGGERVIVMELVEGEDLAQRLQRGRVPVEEALDIARQMADGLEIAHEKGIVHRDLKPANVKLTPDGKVKLLDFGLAKALADENMESGGEASRSPTMTAAATRAGIILGTAAYMSPEQARGRPVDKRADIWAFGCVLYELLTGKRLFAGESVSDSLAAVLKSEADWSLLPVETAPRVVGLLKRCLRKDPKDRLRDIGDARLELAEAASGAPEATTLPGTPPRRSALWIWVAGGLLAGALVATAGLQLLAPPQPAPQLRRFAIAIPQLANGFNDAARISPNGRLIVYSAGRRLWVRDLGRFEATAISGSEGGYLPFWFPDSTRIGFAKEKKIWTWALAGGEATPVCLIPAVGNLNGGAWGMNGKIYFATFRGGLYEVDAAGGDPRLLLSPDSSEVDFHHPDFLPDGVHLVMVAHRKEGPLPVIVVSLPDGKRKTLTAYEGLDTATYSQTGHLLLNIGNGRERILAVPFSQSKLDITGEPFLVAAGGQFPSVSVEGTMIYQLASSFSQHELVWVDREGRTGQIVGQPRLGLDNLAISPDGRKVAVIAFENENPDLWTQDLARGTWSRLVSGPQNESFPIWSPSGDRLFYLQQSNVSGTLMEVPAEGSGEPRSLAEGVQDPPSVSPDGRTLVYSVEKEGRLSLWRLDLAAGREPIRLTGNASASESLPAISPDGRWLAYTSNESGPDQVFIRLFSDGAQKQQVSLKGGSFPFWSRTGDALFFWEGDLLQEVSVKRGATLEMGTPRRLFSAAEIGIIRSLLSPKPNIDVAPDGRFLAVRRSSEDPRQGLLLVENWFEQFNKH